MVNASDVRIIAEGVALQNRLSEEQKFIDFCENQLNDAILANAREGLFHLRMGTPTNHILTDAEVEILLVSHLKAFGFECKMGGSNRITVCWQNLEVRED